VISVLELFKIGIGPSSSHTVGPMKAARRFARAAADASPAVGRVAVRLCGSLAFTGKGHGTDVAVVLGLAGEEPERIDPDAVPAKLDRIRSAGRLALAGGREIAFDESRDIVFDLEERMPLHPNGMRFGAFAAGGEEILAREFYSIGGGFVVTPETFGAPPPAETAPYPFASAAELLALARRHALTIAEIVMANERARRDEGVVRDHLRGVVAAMRACIDRGCRQEGILPGPLKVRRRAARLKRSLEQDRGRNAAHPTEALDWLNMFAIAVNEENAAGGRVVTAPTNGAAGVIPAVMEYYRRYYADDSEASAVNFLLTAGAVGILAKTNASISGAEVDCQGEVGVASAMAAAGLTALLGGTPEQAENAAEIALEHHLGMTCDPVAGLVQVPCIERNAMGAVKAVNAAGLALKGDGTHCISLDAAIKTMWETGRDMSTKYKETSQGGLAAVAVEC
jgi:L-serine dehydratase